MASRLSPGQGRRGLERRPVGWGWRRAAEAFTLIELLATIAIIGVLAGLLLPALAQASAKVRRLDCLNRARQWTMAFKMYAEEHEGWIPRECYEPLGEVTINNWSQVKGRPQRDGTTDSAEVWYNALPPYLEQRPAAAFAAPQTAGTSMRNAT